MKICSRLAIADEGGQKNRNGKITIVFFNGFLLVYIASTYQKEDPIFDRFGTNVVISYDKVKNAVTIKQGKNKLLFNHQFRCRNSR